MTMTNEKTIGVDYDDMWTTHPKAWYTALHVMWANGFSIVGVTFRNRLQEITDPDYLALCERIVYTGGHAKKPTVESMGIKVDIWIDDSPLFINFSYEEVTGQKFFMPGVSPDKFEPICLERGEHMPTGDQA